MQVLNFGRFLTKEGGSTYMRIDLYARTYSKARVSSNLISTAKLFQTVQPTKHQRQTNIEQDTK